MTKQQRWSKTQADLAEVILSLPYKEMREFADELTSRLGIPTQNEDFAEIISNWAEDEIRVSAS